MDERELIDGMIRRVREDGWHQGALAAPDGRAACLQGAATATTPTTGM